MNMGVNYVILLDLEEDEVSIGKSVEVISLNVKETPAATSPQPQTSIQTKTR